MTDWRAVSDCVEDVLLLALACALAAYDAALSLRSYAAVPFSLWPTMMPGCTRIGRSRPPCPVRRADSRGPLPLRQPGPDAASGALLRDRPPRTGVPAARRAIAMLSDPSTPRVADDRQAGDAPSPLRRTAGPSSCAVPHRVAPRIPAGCRRAQLHASHACGRTRIDRPRGSRGTPNRPAPCRALAHLVSQYPALPPSPCAAAGIPAGSFTRAVRLRRAAVRQHHDGRGRHSESSRPRAGRSCAWHRACHWR
ncbi:hypothetical protein ACV229_05595 [Burkholderia sp. MR1-5-21]